VRPEYVLSVTGTVIARSPETVNPKLPTGEVEEQIVLLEILNRAKTPPFEIETIEQVDVDSREDWQRRYGLKIPVLLDDDGSVVCATFFDAEAVRDWLAQQGRRSAPAA